MKKLMRNDKQKSKSTYKSKKSAFRLKGDFKVRKAKPMLMRVIPPTGQPEVRLTEYWRLTSQLEAERITKHIILGGICDEEDYVSSSLAGRPI